MSENIHLPSTVRIFTGHILDSQEYKVCSCGQQTLIRLCRLLGAKVRRYVFFMLGLIFVKMFCDAFIYKQQKTVTQSFFIFLLRKDLSSNIAPICELCFPFSPLFDSLWFIWLVSYSVCVYFIKPVLCLDSSSCLPYIKAVCIIRGEYCRSAWSQSCRLISSQGNSHLEKTLFSCELSLNFIFHVYFLFQEQYLKVLSYALSFKIKLNG